MKKIAIFIIVSLTLGFSFIIYEASSFLDRNKGSQESEVIFEVPRGASLSSISHRLLEKGLISNSTYFKLLAKLQSKSSKLKVGEYKLHKAMRPQEVLEVLVEGKSLRYRITIPEGTNMYEIAMMLERGGFVVQQEFMDLCNDKEFIFELLQDEQDSLEGYLFPETYAFEKGTNAKIIIKTMVSNYKKAISDIGPGKKRLTARNQLILASMIEKETGAPEERTMISSVFHNRLRKKMRLQSDPTILYGMLRQTGIMPKNIRKKDILAPTEYNTYTVRALPKGPITNPGKEALYAAVNPIESDNLFFVSRNDGTHVFTTNYKDHSAAVRAFQLNRKARTGKSWRDRIKKKNKDAS